MRELTFDFLSLSMKMVWVKQLLPCKDRAFFSSSSSMLLIVIIVMLEGISYNIIKYCVLSAIKAVDSDFFFESVSCY